MCGRFTLSVSPQQLATQFELAEIPALDPRYNIAPSQPVAVVRVSLSREERVLELMRWGLIPRWAKDPEIGARMINARSETVAEKPAYREAYKKRRCLIPADGFYEWQAVPGQKRKQPHVFRVDDGAPFAFAGLWERWQGPGDTPVLSCTILTTAANDVVRPIHDRMPVILAPEAYSAWLDPESRAQSVAALLRPYPAERMAAFPVGLRVNDPAYDAPDLVLPLSG